MSLNQIMKNTIKLEISKIEPNKLLIKEFEKIKNDIRKRTGYQGDIKRSLLYRLPETVTLEVEQNITSQSTRTQQSCTGV